jgi:hypothetical protein
MVELLQLAALSFLIASCFGASLLAHEFTNIKLANNRLDKKNIFFMKWILNEATRIIFVVIERNKSNLTIIIQ